ncbi:hypothetical protein DFP72DRAFT_1169079 [Ephemerocybe angulata]|uniref:F-box domain-containing protein n=1 Tax=Ephemerocybe angulata TaxID=980116 RepID=A0A8H6M6D6_9AGAR|nr:hypothetical protein DFP72DRAFT_1169079 [Tulosesus angulatus]
MGKRKGTQEQSEAPRKKAREDEDPGAHSPAALKSEKSEETCFASRLPPEILVEIFSLLILRPPPVSRPGLYVETWRYPGYKNRLGVNLRVRATLQSVCQSWFSAIAANTGFWNTVHIEGKLKNYTPPINYGPSFGGIRREPEVAGDAIRMERELQRAAHELARSKSSAIDLTMVDPSYFPGPNTKGARWGLPQVCPGLVELVHPRRADLASLSISTCDIGFVKELLEPGAEERYVNDWIEDSQGLRRGLPEEEKIELASAKDEKPTVDTISGEEPKSTQDKPDAICWPMLHTLRVQAKKYTVGHAIRIEDRNLCTLSSARFPALRTVELDLPDFSDYPLYFWALPHHQLTSLSLVTHDNTPLLLNILKKCVVLENLTIGLLVTSEYTERPFVRDCVRLTSVKKLCLRLQPAFGAEFNYPKEFLVNIDFPNLESLDFSTNAPETIYHLISFARRSRCALRQISLDFKSTYCSGLGGTSKFESNLGESTAAAEDHHLGELFSLCSDSLEELYVQGRDLDSGWLYNLNSLKLQRATIVLFGVKGKWKDGVWVQKIQDATANGFVLEALHCMLGWGRESERNRPTVVITAVPSGEDGFRAYYQRDKWCDVAKRVPLPTEVDSLVKEVRKIKGKVKVRWHKLEPRPECR